MDGTSIACSGSARAAAYPRLAAAAPARVAGTAVVIARATNARSTNDARALLARAMSSRAPSATTAVDPPARASSANRRPDGWFKIEIVHRLPRRRPSSDDDADDAREVSDRDARMRRSRSAATRARRDARMGARIRIRIGSAAASMNGASTRVDA